MREQSLAFCYAQKRKCRIIEYSIMHGDCLELMKDIPDNSIDLILTDPPYGIDFQSNYRKSKFGKIKNDCSVNSAWLDEAKRVLKDTGAIYCFTRWDVYPEWLEQFNSRFKVKNCIVWFKRGGGLGDLKKGYIYNHEFVIYCPEKNHRLNGKRRNDVFEFSKDAPTTYVHPTQKPVDLLREIIERSSNVGDTVLDCFMGSGSTGVACVNAGRRFIGMELDEKYFESAKQRIESAVNV